MRGERDVGEGKVWMPRCQVDAVSPDIPHCHVVEGVIGSIFLASFAFPSTGFGAGTLHLVYSSAAMHLSRPNDDFPIDVNVIDRHVFKLHCHKDIHTTTQRHVDTKTFDFLVGTIL